MTNEKELREEFDIWYKEQKEMNPYIMREFFLSKFSAHSTELISKIKEIGHQQDDDTIWCEMDKVIEIINQEK